MKRKKILLTMLMSACVAMASGCGETRYKINVAVDSNEHGYVTGGGSYVSGNNVNIKVYPNEGCGSPVMVRDGDASNQVTLSTSRDGKYYSPSTNFISSAENAGNYTVRFTCEGNSKGDIESSSALEYTVHYKIEGHEDKNWDEENIRYNTAITAPDYIPGIEGRVKWFSDEQRKNLFVFPVTVTGEVTLYGKVTAESAKDVVADAIKNFEESSNLFMQIGNNTLEVAGYNEFIKPDGNMDNVIFDYSGSTTSFRVLKNVYYEHDGSSYYKINLGGTSYEITKDNPYMGMDKIEAFFMHDIKNLTGYNVESKGLLAETTNIGDEINRQDVNLSKYEVTKGTDKYTLYMYNGYIYKVVYPNGTTNVIEYLAGDTGFTTPEDVRPLYLVKLDSNNGDLNNILQEYNRGLDKVLKVKPAKGETLATAFEKLKAELKEYAYVVKDGGSSGDVIGDLKSKSISDSITSLYIEIKGEYSTIRGAISELKEAESFTVSTVLEAFGQTINATITDSFNDIKNGTIDEFKKVLISLDALDEEKAGGGYTYNYDTFKVNGNIYEFYKNENDSVPYLVIELSAGSITKVSYYDENGEQSNQGFMFTCTFSGLVE